MFRNLDFDTNPRDVTQVPNWVCSEDQEKLYKIQKDSQKSKLKKAGKTCQEILRNSGKS